MYKTKVDIPINPDRIILKGTQRNDNGYFVAEDGGWFSFTEPFMDSHPEFFEKEEEKSLAEKVLDKYGSHGFGEGEIFKKKSDMILAMQEYHKLAGGWSDEQMIDFWRHLYDDEYHFVGTASLDDAKNAFADYKRQRGMK